MTAQTTPAATTLNTVGRQGNNRSTDPRAVPRVALCFISRGFMPHEPFWRLFMNAAADLMPGADPHACSTHRCVEQTEVRLCIHSALRAPSHIPNYCCLHACPIKCCTYAILLEHSVRMTRIASSADVNAFSQARRAPSHNSGPVGCTCAHKYKLSRGRRLPFVSIQAG